MNHATDSPQKHKDTEAAQRFLPTLCAASAFSVSLWWKPRFSLRTIKVALLLLSLCLCVLAAHNGNGTPEEAPSGFDDKTNGLTSQHEFNVAMGAFNKNYIEREGLGPLFNIETCLRCHQYPTIGGSGLITVTRAGRFDGKRFIAPPGGTLIQGAATYYELVTPLSAEYNVTAKRVPTSLLGAGFIEAIGDETLRALAAAQQKQTNGKIAGEVIEVPVYEASGAKRVGRFGWKNSHASLLSFTAEAMHGEMGLTSPLMPDEITAFGKSLAAYDKAADPEVDMKRLELVTKFMRATKAPGRLATAEAAEAKAGEKIFVSVGCAICHVPTIRTLPAGSSINGDKFTVPQALGNKLIHPFSDFLLHDVGTGDGIVETGVQSTRNKIRTAPLWGTGARMQKLGANMVFLHDGSARTLEDAILRHAGEAAWVIEKYRKMTADDKQQLIKYLQSL